MQTVGVILIIINILTIAAPIAVIATSYQSDFSELVVPPQITQMLNDTFPSGLEIQLPTLVNATVDNASHAVTLTVNFTNPINYNLTLKAITADIQCQNHNFSLGNVALSEPIQISALQTVQIKVICVWTTEAENHFITAHTESANLQVKLNNLTININEIMIQMQQSIGPIDVPL